MKHFTYILFSNKTNKYYIGSTGDLEIRLERHNAGATKSTKPGRPWKIVYYEIFDNKSDSIKRELQIKKMKSRLYIENLILGND